MSEIEFVYWIEIPIRVYAEHQPKEYATQAYPGCPETMGIEDIEICLRGNENIIAGDLNALKNSILEYDDEPLKLEAWERK